MALPEKEWDDWCADFCEADVLDDPPSYWIYALLERCRHRERRAYPYGDYRRVGNLQMCPYPDCDGDTVIDAWPWQKILDGHAKYPAVPKHGERYPL